jgi:hypothetical protein
MAIVSTRYKRVLSGISRSNGGDKETNRACHENLALAERKSARANLGRSRRPPVLQRFASESAERVAGKKMALNVERIVDGGVNGQEPLRSSGRFEALHPPLAGSHRQFPAAASPATRAGGAASGGVAISPCEGRTRADSRVHQSGGDFPPVKFDDVIGLRLVSKLPDSGERIE